MPTESRLNYLEMGLTHLAIRTIYAHICQQTATNGRGLLADKSQGMWGTRRR